MNTKKIACGLFSNLQGLEIGARRAGFWTPFSTDKEKDAEMVAPFLKELPERDTFCVKNVKELTFDDIQKALETIDLNVAQGEVDLLLGGPPCFGITPINVEYRGVFHPLNFLMIEMVRIISEMQPKVVLMEQVPAILTKPMRPFLYLLINSFERLGNYHWDLEVLNAANFGCYQSRDRVIFMLVRKDIGEPSYPEPRAINLKTQSAYAAIGAELIKMRQISEKGKPSSVRIIDGKKNLFPTMTSSSVQIFRNGLWRELPVADRKILAHMEQFDALNVLNVPKLVKMLGMMVLPPFSEALCKHVLDNILTGSPIVNIDSAQSLCCTI